MNSNEKTRSRIGPRSAPASWVFTLEIMRFSSSSLMNRKAAAVGLQFHRPARRWMLTLNTTPDSSRELPIGSRRDDGKGRRLNWN